MSASNEWIILSVRTKTTWGQFSTIGFQLLVFCGVFIKAARCITCCRLNKIRDSWILSRCLLMQREKDVASLGRWSFFVGQMKTAASLFHQQRQSVLHLDLNPVEKLVVRCLTFFRWCVMEADLYELKLCRFLCPLNCATKCSEVPPSSNREMLVFRTEWLAIFNPQACRPAFCAALGKNLPIWFLPSGDSLYQRFGFSRQPLGFMARKNG